MEDQLNFGFIKVETTEYTTTTKQMYKNYDEFNKQKVKCRACYVGKVYNRVVESDGCKINPKIMVVGEAVGRDEVIGNRPFVGKAGKLLRSTLNEFGYRKKNSLITNILPCRPENNTFPTDNELVKNCCRMWLFQEILLTKPDYVLAIGSKPLKFLLNKEGITQNRGTVYNLNRQEFEKEIKCLPTFHPSYVQRKEYMEEGPEILANFRSDIKKLAELAGFI